MDLGLFLKYLNNVLKLSIDRLLVYLSFKKEAIDWQWCLNYRNFVDKFSFRKSYVSIEQFSLGELAHNESFSSNLLHSFHLRPFLSANDTYIATERTITEFISKICVNMCYDSIGGDIFNNFLVNHLYFFFHVPTIWFSKRTHWRR